MVHCGIRDRCGICEIGLLEPYKQISVKTFIKENAFQNAATVSRPECVNLFLAPNLALARFPLTNTLSENMPSRY